MDAKIYFHETDRFPYEPISPIWMTIYTLLSCFFFTMLNQIIVSHKVGKFNWQRHNTLLSFIHSSICSILLVTSILRAPELLEDPLSYSNHFNYALLAFSNGYFLYDLIDCMKNSPTSTAAFVLHHIIVLVFFSEVLCHTRNIGYALYGLSIEINSFFLHGRRLLRWHSPIFKSVQFEILLRKFTDIANYVTFLIFRFGMVIVGLRALYLQRDRVNPVLHIFTTLVTSAMGILNIVLFYKLVKSQWKKKSTYNKKNDDQILINNN